VCHEILNIPIHLFAKLESFITLSTEQKNMLLLSSWNTIKNCFSHL